MDGMKSGVRREERAEGKSSPWERRAGDAAADRASSESPDRRWSKFLLQQLQLSADALALSFLSSFMGSGNSLYSSTSVSCRAIKKQGKRERERGREDQHRSCSEGSTGENSSTQALLTCLRALRAIVWNACSTFIASLALVSK